MAVSESNDSSRSDLDTALPFEQNLVELEARIEHAPSSEAREQLARQLEREREAVFKNLTPWQRVQLARHPLRPRMLDYTSRVLDDLVELHGDRAIGDDPAVVAGIGRFQGQTIVVVGHQKGVDTDEKVSRNFGMAHPEGYRKALRLFELAERLHLPVVTFVDTPAAHPGIEAEQRGQGPAIAKNLAVLSGLKTPVLAIVLAEGGSGGALGMAVGDRVAMFEHAIYVVCPPERCAEILWRDVERKELAASALRITAMDLKEFGVIDVILPEHGGGAHRNPAGAADVLAEEIDQFLVAARDGKWTPEARKAKFRRMGRWREAG